MNDYPTLPAINLPAGSLPVILIDSREQDPLPIQFPSRREGLTTGDYSYVGGNFAIERKSIADLIKCLTTDRNRFKAQLQRLRAHDFARLLIVGDEDDLIRGNYRSRLRPLAALHSLYAIEARYIPVVWASTPDKAARLVERWAFWNYRETVKDVRSFAAALSREEALQDG